MLTEERQLRIVEMVNNNKSVKLNDLCEMFDASVSTIRRDLNFLDEKGLITKVHGGAIAVSDNFSFIEHNVEEKEKLYADEKRMISKYAAELIEDGDFVFIDAGTTTEKIADYVTAKNVTFVTNGFLNAKHLAAKGYKVILPGGEIKLSTEAIVGASCVKALEEYNFTKCFIGVNGVSVSSGYTTPDINEANIKETVIQNSKKAYVLADHSKLDQISFVSFANIKQACLITDGKVDNKYKEVTNVLEVV